MKKLFVFLALLALITSCSSELTRKEIKQNIIDANTGLETYKANISLRTEAKANRGGKPTNVNYQIESTSHVDRMNRELASTGTINTNIGQLRLGGDTAVYLVNDQAYVKVLGTWMKKEFNQSLWEGQDQMEDMIEILENGDITQNKKTEKDGKTSYIFQVEPDPGDLHEILQNRKVFKSEDAIYNISNYKTTFWVNKDTWIIEKSVTEANIVAERNDLKMNMNMTMEIETYDINQPVEITIPEAAKNAKDISSMKESPAMGGITGQVISATS